MKTDKIKLIDLEMHLNGLQKSYRKQKTTILKLHLENKELKEQLRLALVSRSTKINTTEFQEYMTNLLKKREKVNSFLIRAGIINKKGNLTKNYRD